MVKSVVISVDSVGLRGIIHCTLLPTAELLHRQIIVSQSVIVFKYTDSTSWIKADIVWALHRQLHQYTMLAIKLLPMAGVSGSE